MRLNAATLSRTVAMDQTNNAVSIVFFFYIFWRLSLSHSELNVKMSYTFKTKKKQKIVYREPHIYNNISRTGKYKYKL